MLAIGSETYNSQKLARMIQTIRKYLQDAHDTEQLQKVRYGLDAFCLNNTEIFRAEFYKCAELTADKQSEMAEVDLDEIERFIDVLCARDGNCIFLLTDTFDVMTKYQKQTNCGLGLLVNRKTICRDYQEQDYYTLVDLVYRALDRSSCWQSFLKAYLEEFTVLINSDTHFKCSAKSIFELVKFKQAEPLLWIDTGFQFTLSLFCYAAVHFYSEGKMIQDIYNLSVYPWLESVFKGKYFSSISNRVVTAELLGTNLYSESLHDKFLGLIVGFAIGDALGAPVAGISNKDIPRFVSTPLNSFASNPSHPYLGHLKSGQYTDNTSLLLITTEYLLSGQDQKLAELEGYGAMLASWATAVKSNNTERWIGPTTLTALANLVNGTSVHNSGISDTESCGGTYRVIPLALCLHCCLLSKRSEVLSLVIKYTMITHKSETSIAASIFVVLVLAELLAGTFPIQAVNIAFSQIKELFNAQILFDAIQWAILHSSQDMDDDQARMKLGTGALAYQSVPLAIFFFIKYQNNFASAVLAGANSFRIDSIEEQEHLQKYSWEQQLIEAHGGNTDGIAALIGALSGAFTGFTKCAISVPCSGKSKLFN